MKILILGAGVIGPTYAWRVLRYGRSDIGDYDIFPERAILNGPTVSVIERGKAIHFP